MAFFWMFIIGFWPLWWRLHRCIFVIKHRTIEQVGKQKRYDLCKKFAKTCETFTNTKTTVYGKENIPPEETGALLIANHQGKFDALAAIKACDTPTSILMEYHLADMVAVKQVMTLLDGVRIDLNKPRQQLRAVRTMGQMIRAGSHVLAFPEGGYADNHNSVQNFHSGCLYAAQYAQSPIVPICLYDTYLSMSRNNIFKRVHPEVHVLKPIPYEEYKDMTLDELASYVRGKIIEKMMELHEQKGVTYVPWDKDAPLPKAAQKAIIREKKEAEKKKNESEA